MARFAGTDRVSRIGEARVDEMNVAVASKLAVSPVVCMVNGIVQKRVNETKTTAAEPNQKRSDWATRDPLTKDWTRAKARSAVVRIVGVKKRVEGKRRRRARRTSQQEAILM